jgi:hypothetical protein
MTGLLLDKDDRIIRFPAGSFPVRLKGSMNPDRTDLPSGHAGTEKGTIREFTGLSGKKEEKQCQLQKPQFGTAHR